MQNCAKNRWGLTEREAKSTLLSHGRELIEQLIEHMKLATVAQREKALTSIDFMEELIH